jgi:hypothetical protein
MGDDPNYCTFISLLGLDKRQAFVRGEIISLSTAAPIPDLSGAVCHDKRRGHASVKKILAK